MILVPAVALLASAVPARAGGWDSLRFRRDYYLVGHIAEVSQQFFAGKLKGAGSLDAGPYYAYLLVDSKGTGFGMIDPPKVPEGAIPLGTLGIHGPVVRSDGYPYGVASLRFRVPDVPTGTYSIGFCDDPCVHSSIGWLAWGTITIAHTPYEGRLMTHLAEAEQRASAAELRARRSERATEHLRRTLEATRTRLAGARTALEAATRSGTSVAATTSSPGKSGSRVWPIASIAVAAALATVFAAGLVVGSRRARRPGVAVLDLDTVREREPTGVG